MLSNLYLASAVLKRFHSDGEPSPDLPLAQWCCQQLLHECELAIEGIITNFPGWGLRSVLRLILQPFGRQRSKPTDKLGQQLARLLVEPNTTRKRLTRFAFAEAGENCPLGRLEEAFYQICAVEELEKKVSRAVKEGILQSLSLLEQIDEAEQVGILDAKEALQLKRAETIRQEVIAVDDFSDEELRRQPVDFSKASITAPKNRVASPPVTAR